MTEDELLDAIEAKLTAAHRECQPLFLQLAEIQLPGAALLRTESHITSTPTGPNAGIDRVSVSLMEDLTPDGTVVTPTP